MHCSLGFLYVKRKYCNRRLLVCPMVWSQQVTMVLLCKDVLVETSLLRDLLSLHRATIMKGFRVHYPSDSNILKHFSQWLPTFILKGNWIDIKSTVKLKPAKDLNKVSMQFSSARILLVRSSWQGQSQGHSNFKWSRVQNQNYLREEHILN